MNTVAQWRWTYFNDAGNPGSKREFSSNRLTVPIAFNFLNVYRIGRENSCHLQPNTREISLPDFVTSSSVRYPCVGNVTSSLAQLSATGNAPPSIFPLNSGMALIEVG